MTAPAALTGLGLVTALGRTVESTWDALLAGESIRHHARVPNLPFQNRCLNLALLAAQPAIEQAGWLPGHLLSERTALMVGTSKGPIEDWIAPNPQPSIIHGVSDVTLSLARKLNFGPGPKLTISSACASGLHALIRAAMMLAAGEADRVLVVAAEASVHPLFIGGFQRLGVLPPEGEVCRPFDLNRRGFLMSEAAAAVCLERVESPIHRPLAILERFALAGDAVSLTAGDPTGQILQRLLNATASGEIDLIHAHGTGTLNNDPIELAALNRVFSRCAIRPSIYSHKAALGHSLGASGLISIVLNCMMHRQAAIPPNINTRNPLPAPNLNIAAESCRKPIRKSVAIAAGFGGPIAAVALTAP